MVRTNNPDKQSAPPDRSLLLGNLHWQRGSVCMSCCHYILQVGKVYASCFNSLCHKKCSRGQRALFFFLTEETSLGDFQDSHFMCPAWRRNTFTKTGVFSTDSERQTPDLAKNENKKELRIPTCPHPDTFSYRHSDSPTITRANFTLTKQA